MQRRCQGCEDLAFVHHYASAQAHECWGVAYANLSHLIFLYTKTPGMYQFDWLFQKPNGCFLLCQDAGRLQKCKQVVINLSEDCLWNLLSSCSNTGGTFECPPAEHDPCTD